MPSEPALVNPVMLMWARRTMGMDVRTAARRLGVTEARLTEFEEGSRHPSMVQARKAAHVFRRPLATFYLQAPPDEPPVAVDFRRLPDELTAADPPAFRYELRLAAQRRTLATEISPEPRAGIAEILGSATLQNRPASVADRVRTFLAVSVEQQRQWQDAYEALRQWRDAVESLGVLVFRFSGVELSVARGFSIGMLPWPVISLNSKDSPAGRVFTLMHELGHLMLGRGGTCDLDERRGPPDAVTRRTEVYCNRFAADILMPRPAFLGLPQVAQATAITVWTPQTLEPIARRFHVSKDAVLVRLAVLGKTSQQAYEFTRDELRELATARSGTGGFELPPEGTIRKLGESFARLMIDAYHGEQITAADLTDYLGVRFQHVAAIERLLQTAPAPE